MPDPIPGQVPDEETKPNSSEIGLEAEKSIERTRESEIKANTEFWKNKGVEISNEEVRKVIESLPEVEGYDWYIVIPKGLNLSEILKLLQDKMKVAGSFHPDDIKLPRGTIFKDDIKESYAVAIHYNQEPDKDTLGDNSGAALYWKDDVRDRYLSLSERLVAELRWLEENGTHIDEQNDTMCPDCLISHSEGYVPAIGYSTTSQEERFVNWPDKERRSNVGVRRAITQDIPPLTLERYKQSIEK